ncbi:hypothetical protein ACFWUP_13755 [Nocardia sp. NPDC058658]|uniref:hypothetical protein n=1 Tax=Nocardia sp. NPDC058658 TaxID=3346580 RepID=UPI003656217C
MKLQSVVLSSLMVGAAIAGPVVATGTANADPTLWTVVVNSHLTPDRFFEIRDHADRAAAESAALAACDAGFPEPISLGSTSLFEPQCTVQLVFASGKCAVLMRAEQAISGTDDQTKIVYSPGYGADLEWAELDGLFHNIEHHLSSSMPKTVWSGCQG